MDKKRRFLDFAEDTPALDTAARMRLLLFAAGLKPATYLQFRITPTTLDERRHFQFHLQENNCLFSVSHPKSFEQIARIHKNIIEWEMAGTWYGFDVFSSKKQKKLFENYLSEIKRGRQTAAHKIAGKLYGYPACCVREFIREQEEKYLEKKYSYYEYFSRREKLMRKFPFISHTPCSAACALSRAMNTRNRAAIRKHAPKFFKTLQQVQKVKLDVVVDSITQWYSDLNHKRPIWLCKDGAHHHLIALKKINGKYYFFTDTSTCRYERGTVLSVTLRRQFGQSDLSIDRIKRFITALEHHRQFVVPKDI
ncbi:hypothetical protein GF342_00405 [Candidatus Woesearchaeota archaeon]|nr:hypothetical protein [Candidatus Woesearchaeota archaeon]